MMRNAVGAASVLSGAVFALLIAGAVHAESPPPMMHEGHQMQEMQPGPTGAPSGVPTLPGQDVFGAIQEIIGILEADPSTDWTRVDISALRTHLVDMNRLAIDAETREVAIDGGLEVTVTGQGNTLRAIHAMVPAHAPIINGMNGWTVTAEVLPDGVRLVATAATAEETAHIRGLGFFGLMATGSHHQAHHLSMARGNGM